MEHIVLVIHLIVTLVMIVLILLQRSEGGGLGLGGGGGMGNFASAQSTANALTKTTTWVAIIFFTTSITLAIVAARGDSSESILDVAPAAITSTVPVDAPPSVPIDGKISDTTTPTNTVAPSVPIAK